MTINVFYLIWNFLLLGFISVNFLTYKYYCFHIADNKELKEKIKIGSLFFAVLSCWPIFLFLAPMFDVTEIFLAVASVFLLFYLIFLLYLEYKLSGKNNHYQRFKFSIGNILFIAFFLLALIYILRQRGSDEVMLYLLNFSFVSLYLVIFMQIKIRFLPESTERKSFFSFMIFVFADIFYFIWLMFTGFVLVSVVLAVLMELSDPMGTDTCLDVGVCKEGFVFDDCGNGKPCTITKEYCLSNNNIWNEKNKTCNLRQFQE